MAICVVALAIGGRVGGTLIQLRVEPAAGLAVLLLVAFVGLCGIMLAIGRRESHSWS